MNIEVSPEPVPNFTIARIEWGVAWPIHYNTFGIIFALIMIYCLNSLVALLQSKRKFQRRRIFITINILLIYFSLVTSLSLFIGSIWLWGAYRANKLPWNFVHNHCSTYTLSNSLLFSDTNFILRSNKVTGVFKAIT